MAGKKIVMDKAYDKEIAAAIKRGKQLDAQMSKKKTVKRGKK